MLQCNTYMYSKYIMYDAHWIYNIEHAGVCVMYCDIVLSECLPATDIINIHEQNSHIVKLV